MYCVLSWLIHRTLSFVLFVASFSQGLLSKAISLATSLKDELMLFSAVLLVLTGY